MALVCAAAACAGNARPDPAAPSLASSPDPIPDAPALTAEEALEIDTLVMGLFMEDVDMRAMSAGKLGAFGPKARPALPYLIDCLVRDDTRAGDACARAAGRVGVAALPSLERVARGKPDRRLRVVTALVEVGAPATPLLVRLYTDSCDATDDVDRAVAAASARAIGALGAEARATLREAIAAGTCKDDTISMT